MDIQTTTKEHMDSLKELADTNVKISEAKNLLFKLQEEETDYLIAREKKAMDKINNVLLESKELLEQTHSNYNEVHQFCQTVSGYVDSMTLLYQRFQDMNQVFHSKNEIWEENLKIINQELADQRHEIQRDKKQIEEREKAIAEQKESIKRELELIESRRQALEISYKEEKELWNKLQKTSN